MPNSHSSLTHADFRCLNRRSSPRRRFLALAFCSTAYASSSQPPRAASPRPESHTGDRSIPFRGRPCSWTSSAARRIALMSSPPIVGSHETAPADTPRPLRADFQDLRQSRIGVPSARWNTHPETMPRCFNAVRLAICAVRIRRRSAVRMNVRPLPFFVSPGWSVTAPTWRSTRSAPVRGRTSLRNRQPVI